MNYQLWAGVWEITFACNMRCKHCGSGCNDEAPDELTTEEALDLCDQLGAMGMHEVTLSGGEPLVRRDWPLIVKRLRHNKILSNILTNGWLIDEKTIDTATECGIPNIAISLDGLREAHDFMRCCGSYDRVIGALELMKRKGMTTTVITSINRLNLPQLESIRNLLLDQGVWSWQLQMALPMGNLAQYPDLVLRPPDIGPVISFAHRAVKKGGLQIDLGDCLGYYNLEEAEVRRSTSRNSHYKGDWQGCAAGKYIIGIRCNGDITGCNSLRATDPVYIEGNIRETPLQEIWTRPGAFSWNRDLDKEKLTGFCGKCVYGRACLGGCTSLKEAMGDSITANTYCLYFSEAQKEADRAAAIDDPCNLKEMGRTAIDTEEFQLAEIYLSRALQLSPGDIEIIDLLGYAHFRLKNFNQCREMNLESLRLDPDNAYAHKGLGIVLAEMGDIERGIASLKKAIQLADNGFTDPYHDLAVIYMKTDRCHDALAILEKGREKSTAFARQTRDFYFSLKKSAAKSAT